MVQCHFNIICADGSFQRSQHAATQLILIKGFAHIVAFYHARHDQFSHFEGRKAFITHEALPTAAHGRALAYKTRVNDFGIYGETKWAMHTAS